MIKNFILHVWELNLFVRFGGRLGHAQSATFRASIPSRLCPLCECGHALCKSPTLLREAPPLCFISLSSKHKGTTTISLSSKHKGTTTTQVVVVPLCLPPKRTNRLCSHNMFEHYYGNFYCCHLVILYNYFLTLLLKFLFIQRFLSSSSIRFFILLVANLSKRFYLILSLSKKKFDSYNNGDI